MEETLKNKELDKLGKILLSTMKETEWGGGVEVARHIRWAAHRDEEELWRKRMQPSELRMCDQVERSAEAKGQR